LYILYELILLNLNQFVSIPRMFESVRNIRLIVVFIIKIKIMYSNINMLF
jgi:hypothetical protein